MPVFKSFSGMITAIDNFFTGTASDTGCYQLMSVQNRANRDEGVVNFVVSPTTYFVDHVMLQPGDGVTGFYDANAPVPFIYPPQYRAVVMVPAMHYLNVKVDYFDENLLSNDGLLKLNLSPRTHVVLENGQAFRGNPAGRYLIVVYGPTTRSIPPQTSPEQIVVMC
ncbi:MAG TPA: hypothetical protein DDW65_19355 [Firmicutes bacterium]|jgi:hypothetical protein|nr:hypothetical protein [Bacillota bacterium]